MSEYIDTVETISGGLDCFASSWGSGERDSFLKFNTLLQNISVNLQRP